MTTQTTTQTRSLKQVRKLTTPQLMKAGLYVTWGASVLMVISAIAGIQTQRNGLKAVAEKAIPNVFVAQRIKTAMTDIDSIIANQLVEDSLTMSQVDLDNYNFRRGELSQRLVIAARNISLGDAEQKPLESFILNYSNYMAQAERAQFAKERGDRVSMLAAYRQATQILDEKLLSSADEFARVNEAALESSYQAAQTASLTWQGSFALFAIGLIVALIALQRFLKHRTRRTLNPLLVSATAIAVLFLIHTMTLMSTSQTLQFIKSDLYQSIRVMRLGRVQLYLANSAHSRYLLDETLANQHETAFIQHTEQMLKLPSSVTPEMMNSAFQEEQSLPEMTGYFAESLKTARTLEERQALFKMMQYYAQYLQLDQQIRQLVSSGQRQAAIALSTGRKPGQFYWTFDQLRNANEAARDIYTNAFNQTTTQARQSLDGFEVKAVVSLAAIVLLILFGLRPRLREYFI